MPPTHTDEGLQAALRIRRKYADVAVVVLSQHVQRRYASELLASPPQAGSAISSSSGSRTWTLSWPTFAR